MTDWKMDRSMDWFLYKGLRHDSVKGLHHRLIAAQFAKLSFTESFQSLTDQ